MKRKSILLSVLVISTLVLAGFTFPFELGLASSNTAASSPAGDGVGAVSGYTVSDITYTLDASAPGDIDGVNFTITGLANATKVYIELDSIAGTLLSCTLAGTAATCDTSGATVPIGALTSLRVVAAQ